MNIWMSWQELNSVVASKKDIYLYGRSVDWVHKCLNNLRVNPKCIIDREKTYHGKKYFDLEVYPIEKIKIHNEIFIIITAGDYEGIVDLLESRGLKPGYNFVCSPDFQDYKKLLNFHSKNFNILISCSDYNDQTRARASAWSAVREGRALSGPRGGPRCKLCRRSRRRVTLTPSPQCRRGWRTMTRTSGRMRGTCCRRSRSANTGLP